MEHEACSDSLRMRLRYGAEKIHSTASLRSAKMSKTLKAKKGADEAVTCTSGNQAPQRAVTSTPRTQETSEQVESSDPMWDLSLIHI